MTLFPTFPPQTTRRLASTGFTLVEVMISLAVFAVAVVAALGAFGFALKTVDGARSQAQVAQILINEMEAMRMRYADGRAIGEGVNAQTLLGLKNLASPYVGPATPTTDAQVTRDPIPFSDASMPAAVREEVGRYTAFLNAPAPFTPFPSGLPAVMVRSQFSPFAVYGLKSTTAFPVVRVGDPIPPFNQPLGGSAVQLRNASGYKCHRFVYAFKDPSTSIPPPPPPPALPDPNAPNSALVVLCVTWTDSRGEHVKTYPTIIQYYGLNKKIVHIDL